MPESFEIYMAGFLAFAVLGLVFGSFSSAIAYRIPKSLPWFTVTGENKRSFCPSCRTRLGIADLVPVFSWLTSRGKCRHCGNSISIKYPVMELVCLVAAVAVYLSKGLTVEAFIIASLIPFLSAMAFIDFDEMILPDQLMIISGLITCGLSVWRSHEAENINLLWEHLAAAAIFAFSLWLIGLLVSKLLKKEALGFGDVKLFFVAGLGLGFKLLPEFMMLSGIIGIVIGLVWKKVRKEDVFPFGPAIIISFYIMLLLPIFT